ncbi:MAG TPA: Asp-tRNA(Asn)/Glu-tRNA(Gln) amidotransferase subunit GatB [Actinomycetota bacterium]|nr:Asp-tRNA(Asn)/Glu-tRNA(Gln) amidotransferase subunit GatB [Actinomycetota bacterium]
MGRGEEFETVIGLETHVELATATKMFCRCRNGFGAPPNTNVCPICLGHPGTLPVPNQKAIEYTIRIGLALGCEILPRSLFHRKNYFYPDMPKNFQISQYDLPIAVRGHLDLEVDGEVRRVGITRVHLEEDTGKTVHAGATGRIAGADYALEDYNRAGVPLVEVVSEPDLRTPEEARAYVTELQAILQTLGVSGARMEEGQLRVDANVSVRPRGQEGFGTKVEVKNLNSVRSLYRALRYEQERQREALRRGEALVQETRHWDEDRGVTTPLRSKEYAFDYRYFPEPDLSPVEPDPAWVERLRAELPELPAARRARFRREYGLEPRQAALVGGSPEWARFFEEAVVLGADPRAAANWMTGDLAGLLNEARVSLSASRVTPRHLADLVRLLSEGVISSAGAKLALEEVFATGAPVEEVVEARGLRQVSDRARLEGLVEEVIAENPGPVAQFRKGKEGAINALVGEVMKRTRGSANPRLVAELLRERLAADAVRGS